MTIASNLVIAIVIANYSIPSHSKVLIILGGEVTVSKNRGAVRAPEESTYIYIYICVCISTGSNSFVYV